MVLTETPKGELGSPAPDFSLLGIDNQHWSLEQCRGQHGVVVMFICNHCPYVKAIQNRLVEDAKRLQALGVGVVAINSNDTVAYPEDNFENMQQTAQRHQYPFPYLLDETQAIAKAYGAVCTPDFFGYDAALTLRYRGRLDASGRDPSPAGAPRELVEAMESLIATGQAPAAQSPSIGCSIKWKAAS